MANRMSLASVAHDAKLSCLYCGTSFSRLDSTRRHTRTCSKRGSRPIPPSISRGRRAHACKTCSDAKVACNSKAPCGRCAAKGYLCAYPKSDHGATNEPASQQSPNFPLPYLLNVTDPHRRSYAIDVVSKEPEKQMASDDIIPVVQFQSTDQSRQAAHEVALPFWGFMGPQPSESFRGADMYAAEFNDEIVEMLDFFSSPQRQLEVDLSAIAQELRSLAQSMAGRKGQESFASKSFQFFTTDNFQTFLRALAHRRYYQYPLIHWPTFDPSAGSKFELVAIMLTGASYLPYRENLFENASSNALFQEVAEKYIFDRLGELLEAEVNHDTSAEFQTYLSLLQAALLVVSVGVGKHDRSVERIITRRLPFLVASVRKLGMVGCKHDPFGAVTEAESWILREKCIRIVTWTFFIDSLTTLFCNKPPMLLLSELGHLPCDEQVWDQPFAPKGQMVQDWTLWHSTTVRDLVWGLLDEDWTTEQEDVFGRLTINHLHVLVCALQPILFSTYTGMAAKIGTSVLLRAFDRWDSLWDAAMDLTSADSRKWLGVAVNAKELSTLSRQIVEAEAAGDSKSSRYLQRIVKYDFADLHEFITKTRPQ